MDGHVQHRCLPITALLAGIALYSLLALASGLGSCVLAANSVEDDPLLKAAYLYNFAKFTTWPAGTWNDAHEPLVLCIVGQGPLLPALARLKQEKIHGRSVNLQDDPADIGSCHMLYIAASAHSRQARWLEQSRSRPILTISENPGFAKAGGVIELFRKQQRLRFRINIRSVRTSGLMLSSRLLGLAEILGDDHRAPR